MLLSRRTSSEVTGKALTCWSPVLSCCGVFLPLPAVPLTDSLFADPQPGAEFLPVGSVQHAVRQFSAFTHDAMVESSRAAVFVSDDGNQGGKQRGRDYPDHGDQHSSQPSVNATPIAERPDEDSTSALFAAS